MTYVQTARPGSRAPHVWLKPGVSTLDFLGNGYALLRFDLFVDVAPLVDAAKKRGVPLGVIDIDDGAAKELSVGGPTSFLVIHSASLTL